MAAVSGLWPGAEESPGDWSLNIKGGIGLWVAPVPVSYDQGFGLYDEGEVVSQLQTRLKHLGYRMEVSGRFCPLTRQVVMAFQRHWRPGRVDGIADRSTIETLERLLGQLANSVVV